MHENQKFAIRTGRQLKLSSPFFLPDHLLALMAPQSTESGIVDPYDSPNFPVPARFHSETTSGNLNEVLASQLNEEKPSNVASDTSYDFPIQQNDQTRKVSERIYIDSSDSGVIEETSSEKETRYKSSNIAQDFEAQKAELEKARLEIEKLKAEKEAIRKQWRLAANTNIAITEQRNYNRNDEYFIGEWDELSYKIRNWALLHFAKDPSMFSSPRGNHLKDEMRMLTEYVKPFMDSNDHRPLLIQAFVWKFLLEHVFGGPDSDSGMCWAGNAEGDFQRMVAHLHPSM
jgi:hypothetical protein